MRANPCTSAEAARFLGPALGVKANPGGMVDMEEVLRGVCFLARDDAGTPVGAYVLRGQGSEVWVQAAAGWAQYDMCDVLDDLFERHAEGFESIAFRTYRRGLVEKAKRRGYTVASESDGYILRKSLK